MRVLIIGGNRYFGKRLASRCLQAGHQVTLLNRGQHEDGLGTQVERLHCDRSNAQALQKVVEQRKWDLVYDQVCFEARDAKAAIEIFRGRTAHYVFTSSQSVYGPGAWLKESDFEPETHKDFKEETRHSDYAEAKRQCEAVFFQANNFPITAVRFPLVVGADDSSGRFSWHIERVRAKKPVYFPNVSARISMVSSDDASHVLESVGMRSPQGPLNAASADPIVLEDFVSAIERATGQARVFTETPSEETHSPYGISQDWFMDTNKLKSLDIHPRPIQEWLRDELTKYLS
ncbi:MAG: NAD-dependent epimerase/dehydratase family protein [Bdellovibrionales bacterium]